MPGPTSPHGRSVEEKSVSYEELQREGSRPSSSESKKGILVPKSRSSSEGRRSRSNSGKNLIQQKRESIINVDYMYILSSQFLFLCWLLMS